MIVKSMNTLLARSLAGHSHGLGNNRACLDEIPLMLSADKQVTLAAKGAATVPIRLLKNGAEKRFVRNLGACDDSDRLIKF